MVMLFLVVVVVVVVGAAIRARCLVVAETRSRHTSAMGLCCAACAVHISLLNIYEMNDSVGLIQSSAHTEME